MKSKRIAALTVISALLGSLCTGAFAADNVKTTTLTLTIAEPDTSYIFSIPADMNALQSGWNAVSGGINAMNENKTFPENKKVKITASSANNWHLKLDDTNKISYEFKSSESATETVKEWEFSSADLNKDGGETKTLGINVASYDDTAAPGDYTDTVTFTAEVENVQSIIDLSTLTADYEAQNGDILTGLLAGDYKISVADGAKITLKNVTISGTNAGSYKWAGITANGDATIILEETNTVKGFYDSYPGIFVPENKTLTIKGEGSLDASSNGYAPGIGSVYPTLSCGNITIDGGTVTAAGGTAAAGIGGANSSSCGNITINGGTVVASGGDSAPGIGAGVHTNSKQSNCGAITIGTGVTSVTATKGNKAPYSVGIGRNVNGGAPNATCGTITIGGVVSEMITDNFRYPDA